MLTLEVLTGKQVWPLYLDLSAKGGQVCIGADEKDVVFSFEKGNAALNIRVAVKNTPGWMNAWYFAEFPQPGSVQVVGQQDPKTVYSGRSFTDRRMEQRE